MCKLTEHQKKVLVLAGHGLTNMAIAHELGLQKSTIYNEMAEILRRLNMPNRTAAVIFAMNKGLIGPIVIEGAEQDE